MRIICADARRADRRIAVLNIVDGFVRDVGGVMLWFDVVRDVRFGSDDAERALDFKMIARFRSRDISYLKN